ncbi:protein of unknown function DUF305 [Gemmatirosa kalamazoonensis]|uniref:DUF305 domain-containing protein n=1 Tax=Gemmatirosa kalamazoonensis TaxID=861299 RepID=W0RHF2_9BACT|nr:DUF305 domain-containing protein [Gemmatirosa kalamazoonensis]AHG89745.1 protein of unknown function DUF305 [Gemmatirosa kalamazoonensis]
MPKITARFLRRVALPVALTLARSSDAQTAPNAADVRFLQGMIGHHAQAIEMAALVPSRSTRDDMKLLAERIDVSQHDEIATMQRWLSAHHQTVPPLDAHAGHDVAAMKDMPGMPGMTHDSSAAMAMMPGMATPAQMDSLRAARGAAFDRLFLTYMIRHHEGALTMVAQLFASKGAAQEPAVFQLASDVDTDQRAEIARMRALLAALPNR